MIDFMNIIDNVKRHHVLIAFLTLSIVGTFLRIYHIDYWPLWSDELFSASVAKYFALLPQGDNNFFREGHTLPFQDSDTFWTVKALDFSPPLFELLVKFSITIFGSSEISIRLPSLLASIFLIFWYIFCAFKARNKNDLLVFFYVLLLTVFSAPFIQFSQEARPYSLGILFSAIIVSSFYNRMQDGFNNMKMPGWAELIIFLLAFYTHYYSLILSSLFMALYFYLSIIRSDFFSSLKLLLVPLLFVPWLVLNFIAMFRAYGGAYRYSENMDYLNCLTLAFKNVFNFTGPFITFIFCAFICSLFYKFFKKNLNIEKYKTVIFLLAFALIYILAITQLENTSGLFSPRHFLYILPIIYFILAIILASWTKKIMHVVLVAIFIAISTIKPIYAQYQAPKVGYKPGINWLSSKLDSGSTIITTWAPQRFYYKFYLDSTYKNFNQVSVSYPQESEKICDGIKKGESFGIVAHSHHKPVVDAIIKSCSPNFYVAETFYPQSIITVLMKNKNF